MKYRYYYQTRENENREGVIAAKDRNDAYAQLKKQGIKPYKVVGRDPIGWKRWLAIIVLAVVSGVLGVMQFTGDESPEIPLAEPRAQLYGEPAVIRQLSADGWRKTFSSEGDAWFARHAVPSKICDCMYRSPDGIALSTNMLEISGQDAPELVKMKRMANWMKQELAEFMAVGGEVEDYKQLCDERLVDEKRTYDQYLLQFELLRMKDGDISDEWEENNDKLRAMGLPTVPMPELDFDR